MGLLNIIGRLDLNAAPFHTALKGAEKAVSQTAGSFGGQLKGALAGALSVAAVANMIRGVVDATNRIKDLSEQYAITTDEVQKADFALSQSGQEFENLASAMNKLAQARRDAVEGNKELRETFAKYGIEIAKLNDPQVRNFDLLNQIAAASGRFNLTAREQVELTDLLGIKNLKLINTMREMATVKPPKLFQQQDIEAIDKLFKSLQLLKLEAQASVSGPLGFLADAARGGIRGVVGFLTGQVPEGSDVKKRSGGIKGRFELLADLFDETAIRGRMAKPFAEAIANGFKMGIPAAEQGPLFEIDKKAKEEREFRIAKGKNSLTPLSDSLTSVGNFLGANPNAETRNQLNEANRTLKSIDRKLTEQRGGANFPL